jgi:fucose 4-O-acetylase-like acetyltransferase
VDAAARTLPAQRNVQRPSVQQSGVQQRNIRRPDVQRSDDRATPPQRDRFIDVLRVFAIAAIVAQHALMPVLSYDRGVLTAENSLAAPGGWAITWISQVMPLIFFAAGAAAAGSIRRRLDSTQKYRTSTWVAERITRLAVPVLPLAAVWVLLPHILIAAGVAPQPVEMGAELVGRLLWFLAAYTVLIALTPVLRRLADRWAGREVIALAGAAIAIDVVRFGWLGGADWIGYANVALVWGAVYQAGVAYGNGAFRQLTSRRALMWSAVGFAVTALAVLAGPYSASMIGMPGEPLSNMNPPTAVLLGIAVGQLGLALACRDVLATWGQLRPVASALDYVSARAMTIYLWHTPAVVLVAGVATIGFGYATPEPFGAAWRSHAPLWVAAVVAILAIAVHVFSRFERRPRRRPAPVPPVLAAVALALVSAGLLAWTVAGFAPSSASPLVALVAVAAGVGLASVRTHRSAGWDASGNAGKVEA